ncbi:hypothetical protein ACJJTC_010594 [Scirpophaga incertulas]
MAHRGFAALQSPALWPRIPPSCAGGSLLSIPLFIVPVLVALCAANSSREVFHPTRLPSNVQSTFCDKGPTNLCRNGLFDRRLFAIQVPYHNQRLSALKFAGLYSALEGRLQLCKVISRLGLYDNPGVAYPPNLVHLDLQFGGGDGGLDYRLKLSALFIGVCSAVSWPRRTSIRNRCRRFSSLANRCSDLFPHGLSFRLGLCCPGTVPASGILLFRYRSAQCRHLSILLFHQHSEVADHLHDLG